MCPYFGVDIIVGHRFAFACYARPGFGQFDPAVPIPLDQSTLFERSQRTAQPELVRNIKPVIGSVRVLDFGVESARIGHVCGDRARARLAEGRDVPADTVQDLALERSESTTHGSHPICMAQHIE